MELVSEAPLEHDWIFQLRKDELKAQLRKRGLAVSGLKADLVVRLQAALGKEGKAEASGVQLCRSDSKDLPSQFAEGSSGEREDSHRHEANPHETRLGIKSRKHKVPSSSPCSPNPGDGCSGRPSPPDRCSPERVAGPTRGGAAADGAQSDEALPSRSGCEGGGRALRTEGALPRPEEPRRGRVALLCAVAALAAAFCLGAAARRRPPAASLAPSCTRELRGDVWREEVLPRGRQWLEWLEHLELVASHPAARSNKALTVLLAGEHGHHCETAAAAMANAFPLCLSSGCLLRLEGSRFSAPGSAGTLQSELVAFLQRCPKGLVVFAGLQKMSVRALPVLFSALSEGGQFMHDGSAVPTDSALFVFTFSPIRLEDAENADSAEHRVKDEVIRRLLEDGVDSPCRYGGDSHSPHGPCASLRKSLHALRRRFDLVASIAG